MTYKDEKPLKVGIVGIGAVARLHLEAYKKLESAIVVGVADTNPASRAYAEQYLRLPAYSTLRELLDSQSLDVICVLTPPASHEDNVLECARAKVHVLCEKPMALSIDACERMIRACYSNGVRLCYGASYRYLPAIMTARRMILQGDIGQVILLRESVIGGVEGAKRGTLGFTHYPKGGIGGSGMGLCDHGIHLLDVFPWLMNTFTSGAWGRGNISGAPQRPEFAYLEYANGAVGHLVYEDGTYPTTLQAEGKFAWGGGWNASGELDSSSAGSWQMDPGCIHVHGTLGSLRIYHYANALFCRTSSGVRQVELPSGTIPVNFASQLDAFARAIRSGEATPVPGEVGLDACRTLLSIYARDSRHISTDG